MIKNICIFTVGALIGSAVTYVLVKDKYEKIANEEIESVKEAFSTFEEESDNDEELISEIKEEDYTEYLALRKNLYPTDTISYDNEMTRKIVEAEEYPAPYLITRGEFCENMEYESETLTYYRDGVLADDFYEVVHDIEGTVGRANLASLGDDEDCMDTVFVRNEKTETDYEILFDVRTYEKARQDSLWLEES